MKVITETMAETVKRSMYYGKGDVFVYRSFASPLEGVTTIPESDFCGRRNVIFGMNVQVALKGDAFLTSFTEGDNSLVVATDSMKNFVLYQAGKYDGATMEGFLRFVADKFLERYDHISGVEISGSQFLFANARIGGADGVVDSGKVFREGTREMPYAYVETARNRDGNAEIVRRQSGVTDLHLIKIKGSSFYGYIHDEYTTLPESFDRPLYIYLSIYWRYDDDHAPDQSAAEYVAAEQVQGIAETIFHELDSPSIQYLIYEIGKRVLRRFPQLSEVSFESNNKTWETVLEETVSGGDSKVFTDPRPPYGFQGFTVFREDLADEGSE
ncbi:factor-independent urate hydroxylase [Salisediminibacterium halotolerans]|uniref:Uricase n=1 Tax=Salisediminibacterium halotolerans TaxID=517425 RepID=A0A1H9T6R3_9BACI|nr:urate oxidase [Salisediminibacterium haloalkalitolerans]SER92838.1 urate oxidase [Salisediminibacterium haloalkalitolerans]